MTLDESIQGMRLQVIRRAAELGNVTAACREAGISRTLFYRWQDRLTLYGVDGLHPRRRAGRPGPMSRLTPVAERQILAVAIAQATWGCRRLAAYIARWWRLTLAPSTVQRLLRRYGLGTRRDRLLVLEHHSAQRAGLLTERTRQRLWRARHGSTRHVAAREPGVLTFTLDGGCRIPDSFRKRPGPIRLWYTRGTPGLALLTESKVWGENPAYRLSMLAIGWARRGRRPGRRQE